MNRNINIPNALSVYRLLALPFIIYAIATGKRELFIVLLSVNLVTDILDGFIARRFNLATELGARLDSIADLGTYAMAFSGMIVLEYDFVTEHRIEFFFLMGFLALIQVISLIRFRRPTSFHLYSSKVVGYIQGIFIFTFFLFGYNAWYYYLMLTTSFLAELEGMIIVCCIPALRSNVKGLYFILKEHGKIR